MAERYWRLVVYKDGKRIEKKVERTPEQTEKLKAIARDLRSKGIRCHIVGRTSTSMYPPPRTIKEMRAEGKLWCPYCREWRFFKIPPFKGHAEIGTTDWFMNSYYRQGIKACAWCRISEMDWYVGKANGSFEESRSARRRKRARRVRR